jgi:hypothetical protein
MSSASQLPRLKATGLQQAFEMTGLSKAPGKIRHDAAEVDTFFDRLRQFTTSSSGHHFPGPKTTGLQQAFEMTDLCQTPSQMDSNVAASNLSGVADTHMVDDLFPYNKQISVSFLEDDDSSLEFASKTCSELVHFLEDVDL